MSHRLIGVGLAVLLALLPGLAPAADAVTGIHVSGVGELRVVPDMARVTLEVRREGTDAAGLKAELDQVTAAVLKLAAGLGIPERHVTAAAVNIFPRYRPDAKGNQPDGVIASRTLEVTVDDLSRLGALINGALQQGVNGVRGVSLDVSNRAELEARALDAAIDDAVQQAQRIARRFKVELGPLKDARAGSHQVEPMTRLAATTERAVSRDVLAPGEMTIRRDVEATFGIHR